MSAILKDRTEDDDLAAGASRISIAKAKALVDHFARVTTSRNSDEFVRGFTEDCIVRFNLSPQMTGRKEVHDYMAPRFARYDDSYKCATTLRSVSGNVLGVEFLCTWNADGKPMTGRGKEFWIMRGDLIARWDAVYIM